MNDMKYEGKKSIWLMIFHSNSLFLSENRLSDMDGFPPTELSGLNVLGQFKLLLHLQSSVPCCQSSWLLGQRTTEWEADACLCLCFSSVPKDNIQWLSPGAWRFCLRLSRESIKIRSIFVYITRTWCVHERRFSRYLTLIPCRMLNTAAVYESVQLLSLSKQDIDWTFLEGAGRSVQLSSHMHRFKNKKTINEKQIAKWIVTQPVVCCNSRYSGHVSVCSGPAGAAQVEDSTWTPQRKPGKTENHRWRRGCQGRCGDSTGDFAVKV